MEPERTGTEARHAGAAPHGWSRRREAGVLRVRGPLRPAPGLASALALGVGAALAPAGLGLSDPVAAGLAMLLGGGLFALGLRRRLLGSLAHETSFEPGHMVRAEFGSHAPRLERRLRVEELRCLGLTRLNAGPLGKECRLYVVRRDRGMWLLGREAGAGVALCELAEELAALTSLPIEQRDGWPTHEWG